MHRSRKQQETDIHMEIRLNRIALVLILLCGAWAGEAQNILLHRRVPSVLQRNEEDGGDKTTPFNSRTFCMLTYLPIGQDAIFYTAPGASLQLQSENRVVFKQQRPVAIGYNSGIKWSMLSIAQNVQQPLSGGAVHRSQTLQQFAVPLGCFVRFKLSNNGGRIGTFIDLGCNGFWNFSNALIVSDAPDPSTNLGARRITSTYNRLTYINKWGYEMEMRMGRGIWAVHILYRANNLFKSSPFIYNGARLPELARWQLGINLNFWKFKKSKKDEDEI